MKLHRVTLPTLVVILVASCDDRNSTAPPHGSKSSTRPTEQQLTEKRKTLVKDLTTQQSRIAELESDIARMEADFDELRALLKLLDTEKQQMFQDVVKLKKRWASETEEIYEQPSRPIHEHFREMTRKMDLLLQENQELKRKLEGVAK